MYHSDQKMVSSSLDTVGFDSPNSSVLIPCIGSTPENANSSSLGSRVANKRSVGTFPSTKYSLNPSAERLASQ